MPENVIRRCPRCGRKAHDTLLVQCPDCRVPFVYEEQPYTGLTPDQLRLVAAQIFGSWKFWACLIIIVGAAAWGVVIVADRVIDVRAHEYLNTLEQNATNHIGTAFGQISNQIALEFRQPRIRAAIELAARNRAGDLFTNGVQPSLDAFQDALDGAIGQLAKSSNALARLEAEAEAARKRIPPPTPVVTNTPPVAIAQTNLPATPPVKPAVAVAPEPVIPAVKLTLSNRTVTQAGANYILTLFFHATFANGSSGGLVTLEAATYNQTAKIVNFAAMTASPTEAPIMNETGDVGRLRFAVTDRETPAIVIEFSAPTIVRLASDSLDTDLTVPVAADRMQLVPTAK
jgi:hypothetical protein